MLPLLSQTLLSNCINRMLAAPPISGVLYERFGFRAPFIFGIIVTAFDLVFRLLVIERVDALKWGHDPALSKN